MANDMGASILLDIEDLSKDPKAIDSYAVEADTLVKKAHQLSATGAIEQAVEELLCLEKKSRQACDALSCSKVALCIVELYKEKGDYEKINEYLMILSKRRSQLKKVILDLVRKAMEWLSTLDPQKRDPLIETLLAVTAGKMFAEVEKARLTLMQAEILEADGKIAEAASLLQEVQVETFGAMEKREKTTYILKQMRLVLLKGDYIRCQVISRKLNTKLLEADDLQDLKLLYYEYMISYHLSENSYLNIAKAHYHILSTPNIRQDPLKLSHVMKNYVTFLLLSPSDEEHVDLVKTLADTEQKKLAELPLYKKLIDAFLTKELFPQTLMETPELRSAAPFADSPHPGGEERFLLFKQRMLQHDIRVLGEYFNNMTLKRMAELLHITPEKCEEEIAELVSLKFLKAKIDRPMGVVTFGDPKGAKGLLKGWSSNITEVLNLVEVSSHLIQKERMVCDARFRQDIGG